MLMEPDEYTSQERALTDKAKELIEQHELDWGNGECFIQRDAGHSELYMTLEAPNHATVSVTVPAEADEKGLRRAMADGLLDFDPDEEFDEYWSREFAARNGFTPSGFLSGLQEDKAYFGLRSEALLHPGQSNAGQGNETIAEIRWMEEDLRHWLRDNDWPVTEENMDAMRDMISGRTLQDRSIEEGWEIIARRSPKTTARKHPTPSIRRTRPPRSMTPIPARRPSTSDIRIRLVHHPLCHGHGSWGILAAGRHLLGMGLGRRPRVSPRPHGAGHAMIPIDRRGLIRFHGNP